MKDRFDDLLTNYKENIPAKNHVDFNMFGSLPLSLYKSFPTEESYKQMGLSYADIRALRWENIRTLFDGKTWIVTRRRKTGTPSNIPLLEIPQRILDRYGRQDAEAVFDIPSNNCCNEYLNALGQHCGIRLRLSFHIARHTFATLSLSKGMPIETLSSVMGHTNIRTTQIYARITNQKISDDMTQLGEKINYLEGPVI